MHLIFAPELSRLTTLRMGGRASALIQPSCRAELEELPEAVRRLEGRPVVLGRGSNVLAKDGDLPLVLIRAPRGGSPEVLGERPGGRVAVRADAGLALPILLGWCRDRGFSGLEGLSGIPGEVGGAAAMNAGSYGCEFCEHLVELEVFSPETGLRTLGRSELEVEYRTLRIPMPDGVSWWMVVGAVLELTPAAPEHVAQAMNRTLALKRATQPVGARSAGCVFKNPEGMSAGKLLEQAGFRGKSRGGIGFSALHANFLINEGGGTATQALELIAEARERVAALFGVTLQPEVKVWPC